MDVEHRLSGKASQFGLTRGGGRHEEHVVRHQHAITIRDNGGEASTDSYHMKESIVGGKVAQVGSGNGCIGFETDSHEGHSTAVELEPVACPGVPKRIDDSVGENVFREDGFVDAHCCKHLQVVGFDVVGTIYSGNGHACPHRLCHATHHDVAFGGVCNSDEQFAISHISLSQG